MADYESAKASRSQISKRIPLLPARDAVHFPGVVTTLQVVREPSVRALKKAISTNRQVLVLSQRDMSVEEPKSNDLYEVGTISDVLQALPLPDGSQRVTLRGAKRAKVIRIQEKERSFLAEVEFVESTGDSDAETLALTRACRTTFASLVQLKASIPTEALEAVSHVELPGDMADAIASHLPVTPREKQNLLEELDVKSRLKLVLTLLRREEEIEQIDARIHRDIDEQLGATHREIYLREQLKRITTELRQSDDELGEVGDFERRASESGMPLAVAEKVLLEVRRLDRSPAASPEGAAARNWLDSLLALPWSRVSEDSINLEHASQKLEADHFALENVKDRVLDFLAVRQFTDAIRGPILCFAGPPGVGKTSLGRSIAEAMGRKFCRISLGGIRDEAEIRGHRKTYVGSMPGRIIQAVQRAGTRNPVIMLDEIDKLGSDWRGDPTSALLEALDPEQNAHFEDHYVDAPFDLSKVMFIATANVPDMIPTALRDRMEFIQFHGYSDDERLEIGRHFLLPKAMQEHGLPADRVTIGEDVLKVLVDHYSRESGVRSLERLIAALCRKAARKLAAAGQPDGKWKISAKDVQPMLGAPKYVETTQLRRDEVGTAIGLVIGEQGGETMRVETSLLPPMGEQTELRLTGCLGDVMSESAEAALTFIRSAEARLGRGKPFRYDVHIHVPDAAVPKDGPSAGLTIALALTSAFTGVPARSDIAMTGEITLRGNVLAVGGVRAKLLAAKRDGMSAVILPEANRADVLEVPVVALQNLELHFISHIDEALALVLVPDRASLTLA